MNEVKQKLLMMFIRDLYKSHSGKISKNTAIAAMKYLDSDKELQSFVCSGDYRSILNHKD